MKNKKPFILLAAAAIAGAALWLALRRDNFYYSGTVEATEVELSSRLNTVIASKETDEGDAVAQGETLYRLDCSEFELAAGIAQKDYDRASQLYKLGSMTQESYDKAKYKRDDSALKESWCRIKSPLNGTILYTYREAGEMVSPGTKLAALADLSEVWAYIYVPQATASKLSVGMELPGYIPELGMREVKGKISVINEEAEFTPKNVQTRQERTRLVFGVKVTFKNPDGLLKPGSTIEIKLPKGL